MPVDPAAVARALNGVRSNAQAVAAAKSIVAVAERARAGVASSAWAGAASPAPTRKRLSDGILAVQRAAKVPAAGAPGGAVKGSWPLLRREIDRLVVEVYGAENTAPAMALGDVADIVGQAVVEAPGVFLKTLGKATGAVLNEAGKAAGAGVGSLLGGLGLAGGLVVLAVVLLVVGPRVLPLLKGST